MLTTIERRLEIVEKTNDVGKVDVAELAKKYLVSTVTIRNDLNNLSEKGLVVRSRGGAVINSRIAKELSVKEKHCEHLIVKKKLAIVAASLVNDGESIILDSGTTTEEIAKQLHNHKNLVVMTNGLNIIAELAAGGDAEVMSTGGTLRKKSLSFYGRKAESSLTNLRFDKVFLGVDGIDERANLTTHFEHEATLNSIMCDISKEVIAVTDSSKFNRNGFYIISSLDGIDTLLTDSRIPQYYKDYLAEKRINLIIVPHPDDEMVSLS
jgi:DeoR family transcriptional regulator of aga operon|tara:strand:+ start:408 stop:1205 length:798 start_codon:yes stop_codon:yes gene_type:complete